MRARRASVDAITPRDKYRARVSSIVRIRFVYMYVYISLEVRDKARERTLFLSPRQRLIPLARRTPFSTSVVFVCIHVESWVGYYVYIYARGRFDFSALCKVVNVLH